MLLLHIRDPFLPSVYYFVLVGLLLSSETCIDAGLGGDLGWLLAKSLFRPN